MCVIIEYLGSSPSLMHDSLKKIDQKSDKSFLFNFSDVYTVKSFRKRPYKGIAWKMLLVIKELAALFKRDDIYIYIYIYI